MSDQEKMTKILSDCMSINDTKCLNTIAQTVKSRRNSLLEASTLAWQVNDTVQLLPEHQSRKPYGTKGKISKINTKKFKVDFGQYGVWNIPKTMLVKIG